MDTPRPSPLGHRWRTNPTGELPVDYPPEEVIRMYYETDAPVNGGTLTIRIDR